MKQQHLAIILLLFLSSCTKEIDINTAPFQKRIVINSLFTPDKPFTFHFSYTTQTKESISTFTDSIHLWLYENGTEVLDTLILSDTYASTYYPKHTCTYSLKAYIQGYDTLYACDTIPSQIPINEGTKQLIAIDKYQSETCRTAISIQDALNEDNYYELFFENIQYDTENKITDPVLLNEGDISFYPETYFFSDSMFNGKTYTLQLNQEIYYRDETKAVLRNISYTYYKYRKSFTRHLYNQVGIDKGIGSLIYMGEPQTMYNNIKNGYGVFAAYTENTGYVLRKINNTK